MVICRSCSSLRLSMYRMLPANLSEMIPLAAIRESDSVVFPAEELVDCSHILPKVMFTMIHMSDHAYISDVTWLSLRLVQFL
jgi:hypothetical protein